MWSIEYGESLQNWSWIKLWNLTWRKLQTEMREECIYTAISCPFTLILMESSAHTVSRLSQTVWPSELCMCCLCVLRVCSTLPSVLWPAIAALQRHVGLSFLGMQWHGWFPAVICLPRVCFQLYAQGGIYARSSPHASQGAFLPRGRLLELSNTALELNNNSVGISLGEVTHWLVEIVTRCWA